MSSEGRSGESLNPKRPAFAGLKLHDVHLVWDRGEHNAFTDLCRFQGQYWLVFREAATHVSDDGVIIVLCSDDARTWALAATLSQPSVDLRDPKITVTPEQRLLITCAGVMYPLSGNPHQSFLYYSDNGCDWSPPQSVGALRHWIWRTRFFGGEGYGVAYVPAEESTVLYRLSDGQYTPWVDPLFSKASHGLGYPNEHDLFFVDSPRIGCLLRRDADTATAQLGIAEVPYREWQWRDLGVRIGGPVVTPITPATGASALLCAVRLYDPVRTSLCWLDIEQGQLLEILALPSGGDTSYAGLLQDGERILCSYYSSHEGKTAVYLAELTLDDPESSR